MIPGLTIQLTTYKITFIKEVKKNKKIKKLEESLNTKTTTTNYINKMNIKVKTKYSKFLSTMKNGKESRKPKI